MKNLKKRVVLYFFLSISLILNSYCAAGSSNQGLGVGEPIPNPEIQPITKNTVSKEAPLRLHDYKQDKALLIAFMPTINDANNYAKIMTSAFDTYFAQGLSFRQFDQYAFTNPDIKVLIVTPDKPDVLENYVIQGNMDFEMVSDENMNIANFFGIIKWDNTSAGSYVYVVDKNDKIVYANYNYKGEGEN